MYLSLERKRIEQIRKRDQSISIEAGARIWKIDTSKHFRDIIMAWALTMEWKQTIND